MKKLLLLVCLVFVNMSVGASTRGASSHQRVVISCTGTSKRSSGKEYTFLNLSNLSAAQKEFLLSELQNFEGSDYPSLKTKAKSFNIGIPDQLQALPARSVLIEQLQAPQILATHPLSAVNQGPVVTSDTYPTGEVIALVPLNSGIGLPLASNETVDSMTDAPVDTSLQSSNPTLSQAPGAGRVPAAYWAGGGALSLLALFALLYPELAKANKSAVTRFAQAAKNGSMTKGQIARRVLAIITGGVGLGFLAKSAHTAYSGS